MLAIFWLMFMLKNLKHEDSLKIKTYYSKLKVALKSRQHHKWKQLKSEDDIKNKDTLKNEDYLKNEDFLKNETT